jgi:CRP/FNR family cyclic AMP-dependent transcriptional regulator
LAPGNPRTLPRKIPREIAKERPMGTWDGVIRSLEDELAREFAQAGRVVRFAAGELLLREGDKGDSLLVILAGRVRVFVADRAGREMVVGRYGPGEIVGELAIDGKPRSASVRATEAVACSVLPYPALFRLLAGRPRANRALLARLAARARAATLHVKNLALLDVYGRVARLLVEMEAEVAAAAKSRGRRGAARGPVPDPAREALTMQEIANRVGASRDMVGKILKELIKGGYIARDGRRITVLRRPPARW